LYLARGAFIDELPRLRPDGVHSAFDASEGVPRYSRRAANGEQRRTHPMADKRRSEKLLKKDVSGPREAREELGQEIRPSATEPRQKNPNRDRARGDWDRSGIHHDEGTSRAEE
jgi:hypothetical protein